MSLQQVFIIVTQPSTQLQKKGEQKDLYAFYAQVRWDWDTFEKFI